MSLPLEGEDLLVDPATREAVIRRLIQGLEEHYIFPDTAKRMVEDIRARAEQGEYNTFTTASTLAAALQEHIQAISQDRHLRVRFTLEPQEEYAVDSPEPEEARRARFAEGAVDNYGFYTVERLPGNIGYLDLRIFLQTDMAGDTAAAAMQFLGNSSALIVDLRNNRGGSPAMIAFITTYLFEKPVHLNTFHWRDHESGIHQWWTLPYVPGKRFGASKPVYVLTSSRTFSGGEEFAYNLKNLRRATLIGETTRGGAHPVGSYWLSPHFHATMPLGRAVNPISNTNWEGTGVEPDIAVPEAEAYDVAYRMALRSVLAADMSDLPERVRKDLQAEAQEALDLSKGDEESETSDE
jgi:C-terminal processing protease CtpA/Prc